MKKNRGTGEGLSIREVNELSRDMERTGRATMGVDNTRRGPGTGIVPAYNASGEDAPRGSICEMGSSMSVSSQQPSFYKPGHHHQSNTSAGLGEQKGVLLRSIPSGKTGLVGLGDGPYPIRVTTDIAPYDVRGAQRGESREDIRDPDEGDQFPPKSPLGIMNGTWCAIPNLCGGWQTTKPYKYPWAGDDSDAPDSFVVPAIRGPSHGRFAALNFQFGTGLVKPPEGSYIQFTTPRATSFTLYGWNVDADYSTEDNPVRIEIHGLHQRSRDDKDYEETLVIGAGYEDDVEFGSVHLRHTDNDEYEEVSAVATYGDDKDPLDRVFYPEDRGWKFDTELELTGNSKATRINVTLYVIIGRGVY